MRHAMKRWAAGLLALTLLVLAACAPVDPPESPDPSDVPSAPPAQPMADPTDDNYRVFYQIFVGSFSDSDGDGVGDLRGIIDRMDYLNDGDINSGASLGVQGLWLSPIFLSPSYHKYDATDYYRVDPQFGSEDDLRELVELCHSRNVKVILDLAINHTSSRSDWFLRFQQAHARGDDTDPYFDFYTWVLTDGKRGGVTYYPIPGCQGQEWYEGNFSSDMPELNFDNDAVRQQMVDVAKYYLDLGVDGFRFDAIKYIYYGETSRSVDFWDWYMDELRAIKPDIYCVGECWSGEPEVLQYCTAVNCFNFAAAQGEGQIAAAAKGGSLSSYTGYVAGYQQKIADADPAGIPMWFIANHDMDRAAGYLTVANGSAYMGANLLLLLPGSSFVYYGEELGMKGTRGSANTDANRRLAMLWGDGDTVRDPQGATYDPGKQTNGTAASQQEDEGSLFSRYRQLISLRVRYPAIARGRYTSLSLGAGKAGGFLVEYGGETLAIVHNVDPENTLTVDLSKAGVSLTQVLETVGTAEAALEGDSLTLPPQTSVILK